MYTLYSIITARIGNILKLIRFTVHPTNFPTLTMQSFSALCYVNFSTCSSLVYNKSWQLLWKFYLVRRRSPVAVIRLSSVTIPYPSLRPLHSVYNLKLLLPHSFIFLGETKTIVWALVDNEMPCLWTLSEDVYSSYNLWLNHLHQAVKMDTLAIFKQFYYRHS